MYMAWSRIATHDWSDGSTAVLHGLSRKIKVQGAPLSSRQEVAGSCALPSPSATTCPQLGTASRPPPGMDRRMSAAQKVCCIPSCVRAALLPSAPRPLYATRLM